MYRVMMSGRLQSAEEISGEEYTRETIVLDVIEVG